MPKSFSTKTCFFRFFHDDWLRDTRPLSPLAKGVWIDLICLAWSSTTSQLQASYKQFSRMLGADESEFRSALSELRLFNIADVSESGDLVTIECRRMRKDLEMNAEARSKAHDRAVKAGRASHIKRASSSTASSTTSSTTSQLDVQPSATSATSATSESVGGIKRKARKPALSEEDWLATIRSSPAYQGIDVDREFARARVWCELKNRQLTQRFFLNWMNKADKPLASKASTIATPAGYVESFKMDPKDYDLFASSAVDCCKP